MIAVLSVGQTTLGRGQLDRSFGGDGKVTTVFPNGGVAMAVATQADSKIVVAGTAGDGIDPGDFVVARYRSDGTLDASFGQGGIVATPISAGFDQANAVAVDEHDRIIVAGHAGEARFAVARYLADGTLDPTFGGGIVTTDFTAGTDIAHGIAVQPDGRIVVAGEAGSDAGARFAVARYRTDGSLDPTFSGNGKVLTRLGRSSRAMAVALRPDGKLIVAGWSLPGPRFALARYRPDGALDPGFGDGDGKVTGPKAGYGLSLGSAYALAMGADRKIVVGGVDLDRFQPVVARYLPDGDLDRTFSGDGWVSTSVGQSGDGWVVGLVVRRNGRIVAVVRAGEHEPGDGAVARIVELGYTTDGRLDRAFGTDGKVVTRFAGGVTPHGVAGVPGGGVLVVGAAGSDPASQAFALARYLR